MSQHNANTAASSIDLDRLNFRAKIDLVTLRTSRKMPLPKLDGRVKWSRKEHFKRFTLHDPSPNDISALAALGGPLRILELEVAVDVRPALTLPLDSRLTMLEAVMVELFAKRLDPRSGGMMRSSFRAFYRRLAGGYTVGPFNRRLPLPTDQQLHGGRTDAAQVKAYLKRVDQGRVIELAECVARVEVRLAADGLDAHGLKGLTDLDGFKYRKQLMPYFRHFAGAEQRQRRAASQTSQTLRRALQQIDQRHWQAVGVGAFVGKGDRESTSVRLRRDQPVNKRIGQALGRLEANFRITKSARLSP